MKKLGLSLVLLSIFLLQSCATILRGDEQVLNVNANVEGAKVYVNNRLVGETPFSGKIKKEKSINIKVTKEGYSTLTRTYEADIDSVFWVNILSGGVTGSTTDYANGSMWKVNEGTIYFNLKNSKKTSLNFEKKAKIKHFVMTNFENLTNELARKDGGSYVKSLHGEFFSKLDKKKFSAQLVDIFKSSRSDAIVFGEKVAKLYK